MPSEIKGKRTVINTDIQQMCGGLGYPMQTALQSSFGAHHADIVPHDVLQGPAQRANRRGGFAKGSSGAFDLGGEDGLVGIAQGVGPYIAIPVGIVAMVSIVYSIRRFWRADHSKRWHYTVFGTVIIGFLIYLTIADTIDLLN